MNVYFDASALVKRLVEEQWSFAVIEFAAAQARIATAEISRVEVAAALAQAARMGRISSSEGRAVRAQFTASWPLLFQVRMDEGVLALAESEAWQAGLRAYDAVQLASALRFQEIARAPVVMACFDVRLRAAAAAAGLDVWPAMP